MNQLNVAVPEAHAIQRVVQQARAYALRNPQAWAEALHGLTQQAGNDVIFAAMDGDEAQTGRRLIHWLRERILADATDRAQEEISERFDAGLPA